MKRFYKFGLVYCIFLLVATLGCDKEKDRKESGENSSIEKKSDIPELLFLGSIKINNTIYGPGNNNNVSAYVKVDNFDFQILNYKELKNKKFSNLTYEIYYNINQKTKLDKITISDNGNFLFSKNNPSALDINDIRSIYLNFVLDIYDQQNNIVKSISYSINLSNNKLDGNNSGPIPTTQLPQTDPLIRFNDGFIAVNEYGKGKNNFFVPVKINFQPDYKYLYDIKIENTSQPGAPVHEFINSQLPLEIDVSFVGDYEVSIQLKDKNKKNIISYIYYFSISTSEGSMPMVSAGADNVLPSTPYTTNRSIDVILEEIKNHVYFITALKVFDDSEDQAKDMRFNDNQLVKEKINLAGDPNKNLTYYLEVKTRNLISGNFSKKYNFIFIISLNNSIIADPKLFIDGYEYSYIHNKVYFVDKLQLSVNKISDDISYNIELEDDSGKVQALATDASEFKGEILGTADVKKYYINIEIHNKLSHQKKIKRFILFLANNSAKNNNAVVQQKTSYLKALHQHRTKTLDTLEKDSKRVEALADTKTSLANEIYNIDASSSEFNVLNCYKKNSYRYINNLLRSGVTDGNADSCLQQSVKDSVDILDNVFLDDHKKVSTADRDFYLWRGATFPFTIQKSAFKDLAYLSTSPNIEISKLFVNEYSLHDRFRDSYTTLSQIENSPYPYLLLIKVPKGSKYFYFNNCIACTTFKNELEVLLPRNATLKIVRHFEYIPSKDIDYIKKTPLHCEICDSNGNFTDVTSYHVYRILEAEYVPGDLTVQKYEFSELVNYSELINLLKDFSHYNTTNSSFHSGDLYDHSVWTSNAMVEWWKESTSKNNWVNGINNKYKDISILAALLHDIGKGGDYITSYYDKGNHPRDGYSYFMKFKPYFTLLDKSNKNEEIFDFDNLFKIEIAKKITAIISDLHWDFGNLIKKCHNTQPCPQEYIKNFLDKIKKAVLITDYNDGIVDENIIRLVIAIGAADVKGSSPVKDIRSNPLYAHVLNQVGPTQTHEVLATDRYEKYQYDTVGKRIKDEILDYFNKGDWKSYTDWKDPLSSKAIDHTKDEWNGTENFCGGYLYRILTDKNSNINNELIIRRFNKISNVNIEGLRNKIGTLSKDEREIVSKAYRFGFKNLFNFKSNFASSILESRVLKSIQELKADGLSNTSSQANEYEKALYSAYS